MNRAIEKKIGVANHPYTASSFSETMRVVNEMLYNADRENRTAKAVSSEDVRRRMWTLNQMLLDLGGSDKFPNDLCSSTAKVHRIDVKSYGIDCTWNLLRHVYMSLPASVAETDETKIKYGAIEIHAGMSNYDNVQKNSNIQQLMYATTDYYGEGRCEGYVLLCEMCATAKLVSIQCKNDRFCLPFNNCDTIVPYVYQTPLLWFGILYATIGVALSTETFNAFIFALFVPFLAFLFTALYNRTISDEAERTHCELQRCQHVNSDYR